MTLGWRLAGDCDSYLFCGEEEREEEEVEHLLQITVNTLPTCMQGLGACSLLTVEMSHTVSPLDTASRLFGLLLLVHNSKCTITDRKDVFPEQM